MVLEPLYLLWIKFLHAAHLATAIATIHPEIPPERVIAAVGTIIVASECNSVDEEGELGCAEDTTLVSELTWGESGYNPKKVNAKYGACGPLQVLYSTTNRAYQDRLATPILANALTGYRAGVQKLRDARAHCRRHRKFDVLCEIAGFRSGPQGIYGEWYAKPREIWERRNQLRDVVRSLTSTPAPQHPTPGS